MNRAFSAGNFSFYGFPGALPQASVECCAFGAKHTPCQGRGGTSCFLPEHALVRSSLGIGQQNPGAARPAGEPCQIVTLNIYEMGLEERPFESGDASPHSKDRRARPLVNR